MFDVKSGLRRADQVNDLIWGHLHTNNTDAIQMFNPKKFDLDTIAQEINLGCSPCPDITSSLFGKKQSVLFLSTVYGKINPYLNKKYDRTNIW